jgi:chorismate dehydratase
MVENQLKWRIGAVSYLNTLPLVHGLAAPHHDFSLTFDLPSRLADQLADGRLDVALIPSIEVFQRPDYMVVSDACIACRGPVWSVKLMSRVPLSGIRNLALDEGSRTSIALVRLLLEQQFSVRPQLETLPLHANWQEADTDAVLIIGDRAMNPPANDRFCEEVDLGQWWYEQTGLPFVFAMWTARAGIADRELGELDRLLSQSRDRGVAAAETIATRNAARYGLSYEQAVEYFRTYLHFTLGPEERFALGRFRELAADLNLAPASLNLQYHDC